MKTVKTSRKRRVGPGRRPAGSPPLDRQIILTRGLELARTLPLQEISVVRMAKELDVTAASIRYHLLGRDALTAGIVNLFFQDLVNHWPPMSGDWKSDLSSVAKVIYRRYLHYPGVTAYFAAENRFRILGAATQADSRFNPATFLERYFAVFRRVGLDVQRSTEYAIILLQLLHMAAHAMTRHRWLREHELLAKQLRSLDPGSFPNIVAMRESYLRFVGEGTFKSALELILAGLELERKR